MIQFLIQLLLSGCAIASASPSHVEYAAFAEREEVDLEAAAEAAILQKTNGSAYVSSRAYYFYMSGILHLIEERFLEAEQHFRGALLFDRESKAIRLALARAQIYRDVFEPAIANIKAVLAREPCHPEALSVLETLLERTGGDTDEYLSIEAIKSECGK